MKLSHAIRTVRQSLADDDSHKALDAICAALSDVRAALDGILVTADAVDDCKRIVGKPGELCISELSDTFYPRGKFARLNIQPTREALAILD